MDATADRHLNAKKFQAIEGKTWKLSRDCHGKLFGPQRRRSGLRELQEQSGRRAGEFEFVNIAGQCCVIGIASRGS